MKANKYAIISGCLLASLSFVKEAKAIDLKVINETKKSIMLTIIPQTGEFMNSHKQDYEISPSSTDKPFQSISIAQPWEITDKDNKDKRVVSTFEVTAPGLHVNTNCKGLSTTSKSCTVNIMNRAGGDITGPGLKCDCAK